MAIIKPRLVDYFNIPVTQEDVDFAIPLLDEDIPLYLDPFLLWKSPSLQDNALHSIMINNFNYLGILANSGKTDDAISLLIQLSECREVGLGTGKTKRGLRVSKKTANEILNLFITIQQIKTGGFTHLEEIQLYVDNISKDRISDIACNLLKSFMVDLTKQECDKYGIPVKEFRDILIYDSKYNRLVKERVHLPYNPEDNTPIILVPKRWLRFTPWISYEDYFDKAYIKEGDEVNLEKASVLTYNRQNYDVVKAYISIKERKQADCKNDPLFKQIPVISAKKTFSSINSLPIGKINNAEKHYEDCCAKLLASLLYPHLDFADVQSRTDSGTQIRDLIFYNNCNHPFLKTLYNDYDCRQIVFEMKNVAEIDREHINQLNRYLSLQFGRFGIIVTRASFKKNIFRNAVDLWSGQRKCIICLTDEDLKMMVDVYESKQRDPIEVINKKYVEFIRACPA